MQRKIVTPTDLVSRHGEEFLIVTRTGGQSKEICLDWIRGYQDV